MAFSSETSDSDCMAAYVEEFLNLGSERQQTVLDNLSRYSDGMQQGLRGSETLRARAASSAHFAVPQAWNSDAQAAFKTAAGLPSLAVSAHARGYAPANLVVPPTSLASNALWSQTAAQEYLSQIPAKVEVPRLNGPPKDTLKLKHATQMLQAALANWEACVSEGQSPGIAGQALKSMGDMVPKMHAQEGPSLLEQATRQKMHGLSSLSSGLQQQVGLAAAGSANLNPQQINHHTNLLEKALLNVNDALPTETAEMAQHILDSIALENFSQMGTSAGLEKLKWLAHLLEHQNQVSMEKLSQLVTKDQVAAQNAARTAAAVELMKAGMGGGEQAFASAGAPGLNAGYLDWNRNAQRFHNLPVVGAQQNSSPWVPDGGSNNWWPDSGADVGNSMRGLDTQRKGGGSKKRVTAEQGTAPPEGHQGETLRMHLRSLLNVESSRVLIVRKINRLGFSSPAMLKEHFSWYGTVENVLVAHSRVKSGGGQAGIVSRLRPSGLGFIVMRKTDEAESILATGPEQQVCGTVIRVQKFERRMSDMADDGEDDEDLFAEHTRALGA